MESILYDYINTNLHYINFRQDFQLLYIYSPTADKVPNSTQYLGYVKIIINIQNIQ